MLINVGELVKRIFNNTWLPVYHRVIFKILLLVYKAFTT